MFYFRRVVTRRGQERLIQRLVDIDDYQRRAATSLDSSLRRVHTDMHHLSGGLLDIIMSVQRLEDKLDRLASVDSEARTSSPSRAGSTSRGRPQPAAVRRSNSRGHASESSGQGLKKAKRGQPAPEKESANRRKDKDVTEQPKPLDGARIADMPLEVSIVARKQAEEEADASTKPSGPSEVTESVLDAKFADISKRLERIALAVGVKVGHQDGDDEEDRRRLKEKLKVAIELDRRTKVRTIVSSSEMWLEYIFGICPPDKRVGKRGSRYSAPAAFICR
jgi:hypothetical protein